MLELGLELEIANPGFNRGYTVYPVQLYKTKPVVSYRIVFILDIWNKYDNYNLDHIYFMLEGTSFLYD